MTNLPIAILVDGTEHVHLHKHVGEGAQLTLTLAALEICVNGVEGVGGGGGGVCWWNHLRAIHVYCYMSS